MMMKMPKIKLPKSPKLPKFMKTKTFVFTSGFFSILAILIMMFRRVSADFIENTQIKIKDKAGASARAAAGYAKNSSGKFVSDWRRGFFGRVGRLLSRGEPAQSAATSAISDGKPVPAKSAMGVPVNKTSLDRGNKKIINTKYKCTKLTPSDTETVNRGKEYMKQVSEGKKFDKREIGAILDSANDGEGFCKEGKMEWEKFRDEHLAKNDKIIKETETDLANASDPTEIEMLKADLAELRSVTAKNMGKLSFFENLLISLGFISSKKKIDIDYKKRTAGIVS